MEKKGPPPDVYPAQPLYPTQPGGYPQEPPPQYPNQPGHPYPQAGQPVVVSPPQPVGQMGQTNTVYVATTEPYVNDHLAYSIFVTICCCWCIGIFAIVKSCNVRDAARRGDIAAAQQTAREAKKLAHIALAVGIVCLVIYTIIAIVRIVFAVQAAKEINSYDPYN